jgi:hypothetical protein
MSVHTGSLWIDRNFAVAPKDKWIAVGQNGVISLSDNITTLYAELAELRVNLGTITISFLPGGIRQ